jgi:hypothetical protein
MRSFVYSASSLRTYSVSVAKLVRDVSSEKLGRGGDVEYESKAKPPYQHSAHDDPVSYVLSEPIKLAGPDLLCIVIVDDIVVGFEAAMVEIRVVVNTGIIVIGKV